MQTAPRGPVRAVRHETRALLRAHLAAATRYRHATRHCPVCHRLLRLAWEQREQHGRGEGEIDSEPTRNPAVHPRAA